MLKVRRAHIIFWCSSCLMTRREHTHNEYTSCGRCGRRYKLR